MTRRLRPVVWALLVLVTIVALSFGDFYRRTRSTFVPTAHPLPGVVFTGQFSRVRAGLDLFERGHIAPLLISGTNPGAGIPMAGFADQFNLSAMLRTALAGGAIVLGAEAKNTFENARETRQWLNTVTPGQPVVLITSQLHMPRASLALEQAVSDRQVLRYAVVEDTVRHDAVAVEFWKHLGTLVLGWGG